MYIYIYWSLYRFLNEMLTKKQKQFEIGKSKFKVPPKKVFGVCRAQEFHVEVLSISFRENMSIPFSVSELQVSTPTSRRLLVLLPRKHGPSWFCPYPVARASTHLDGASNSIVSDGIWEPLTQRNLGKSFDESFKNLQFKKWLSFETSN